ncbi:Ribosomal RNA small subunit methyltransferase H [Sedimentisphaera cyanobacteriorum]|uniref:Ribosomal RNA small subunit methyltransferase H n=1 Tax=Sedimentisphaera cyanobacteriorum TaxID=1940790 RepID=A0A1Q2HQR1_9BACT|nr:16S rRNA (cytosine(1402)-N(4))-methyltransferase RsmH [Sedimentisphaera cyanobacteriorum]AQQ09788.1 Ribosomal RNA small subunit methyltransferase H [Sedimentisphaera cyanobacteriorum]
MTARKKNNSAPPLRAKGKTKPGTHKPVLEREILKNLSPGMGETAADCTLGYGGHAGKIMEKLGEEGLLLGFDVDIAELKKTEKRLSSLKCGFRGINRNFRFIKEAAAELGISGFDVILADLGVSSMQVDNPQRGISYKSNGPLDMRMDTSLELTGEKILREYSEGKLSEIFDKYSDEPDSETIASFIAGQRKACPITTVNELIDLILNAKGYSRNTWQKHNKQSAFGASHPAARVFQALRIEVNDELGALKDLLKAAPDVLSPDGRLGIISFHQGEDRLVKKSFAEGLQQGYYTYISKKPAAPSAGEIAENPRSSSAKFRWAVKCK